MMGDRDWLGEMFGVVHKLGGADAVARFADEVENADDEEVERDVMAQIDRTDELMKEFLNRAESTEDDRSFDLRSMCFFTTVTFATSGPVTGAVTVAQIIKTAYRMGARDARLQVFQEAEVQEDAGD
jgi:hypothetical protein